MSRRSKDGTAPRAAAAAHRGGFFPTGSGDGPTDLKDRWMVLGVCIFLAGITWLVFGQTLRHEFVNFDDGSYILKNPQVTRGLTGDGIAWAFKHVYAANWHPLTWLSHMLDCQLYGLNSGRHHLTNVLLHTTTAILLFLALRQMTGALWRSAFVAAVFAIHPLRVESVAWVAERKDVLSGLFFVLTIWAYVRYTRRSWSSLRYGLVVLLFALGLMCKPMLVTLPLVLLLLDYWPLQRLTPVGNPGKNKIPTPRAAILEKLPLLALAAASCVVTLFAQQVALQSIAKVSIMTRFGNALISCVVYLRQMFWPSGLVAQYPFAAGDVRASSVLVAAALLAAISTAVFFFRRRRYLVTGWLWYLIMLGPVIGIFQVGSQAHADRYTYLPQIGLYLLLTWGAVDLFASWRHYRLLLGPVALSILVALTLSAHTQASYWQNSESLWRRALAFTSANVIAEQNLGQALYEKGLTDEAIAHFQKALQINPDQASVHSSLSVLLLEMGRPEEALIHLRKALEIDPNDGDAYYNLGNTFLAMGRSNEAVAQYDRALKINPYDTEALNNLAWVLSTCPDALTRDGAKAVALAEQADSLTRSESPVISATLAAAYAETGRFADALKTAHRAVQLATAEGNLTRANSIHAQIEAYQSGAAFRERR